MGKHSLKNGEKFSNLSCMLVKVMYTMSLELVTALKVSHILENEKIEIT